MRGRKTKNYKKRKKKVDRYISQIGVGGYFKLLDRVIAIQLKEQNGSQRDFGNVNTRRDVQWKISLMRAAQI